MKFLCRSAYPAAVAAARDLSLPCHGSQVASAVKARETTPGATRVPQGGGLDLKLQHWWRSLVPTASRTRDPRALEELHTRAGHGFAVRDFSWDGRLHSYRLFVPATSVRRRLPLVVMLHGCKQDAADFAQGTRMNLLAQAQGVAVLYPQQDPAANRLRCWNWFDPAHQGPAGEPAMIAALTRHVMQSLDVDPGRVYVAGLSAGAAMGALIARVFPGMFAALGVHSGVPAGAASNVIAALGVMRRGNRPRRGTPDPGSAVLPTIVFHGSADRTVNPDNGANFIAMARAAYEACGIRLQHQLLPSGAVATRSARREGWYGPDGKCYLEQWVVEHGPHAWSGGHPDGSHTDPEGPDASAAMLEFFLRHRR